MTDIHDILLFEDRLMDPALPTGLWFCQDPADTYAVAVNAVCLAAGAAWHDIGPLESWFLQFKYVLIISADSVKRAEMETQLHHRLPGVTLLSARTAAFMGCTSASALKSTHGLMAVERLLCGAAELPAYGLLNISDVPSVDLTQLPRVLSGIDALDRATGGFFLGDVTVWSGRRGEGKSTMMHQILLRAADQGSAVCLYSGELRRERVKDWLYLQAAGPSHTIRRQDSTGHVFYDIPEAVRREIDAWLDRRFFLYDTAVPTAHDEDSILRVFEYAARRHGCTVFAVDNLMTVNLFRGREPDYYRAQSAFVGRCASFAKDAGAHIHLVAHPRKAEGKLLSGDDIGGSGDIGNRADNILTVSRTLDMPGSGYDAGLTLLKSRWTGERAKIALKFEAASRRYYAASGGVPDWRFGWEKVRPPEITALEDDTVPFI